MGDKTGISWTMATWNPIVGCSILSPGCKNCYAMKMAARLEKMGAAKYAGLTSVINGKPVWNGTIRMDEKSLDQPIRWKRPRVIFVNSMSDLFHEDLPEGAVFRIIDIMVQADWHKFQVLTKRTRRMVELLAAWCASRGKDLPDHIAWGTTVEDQARADERIPELAKVPGKIRFISCEPLIGPLDLSALPKIEWVIVGGESAAPGDDLAAIREFDPAWAEVLAAYCIANGILFFFKQFGSKPKGIMLKDKKGGDVTEFPANLVVRQVPWPVAA
jgi:protein gp37